MQEIDPTKDFTEATGAPEPKQEEAKLPDLEADKLAREQSVARIARPEPLMADDRGILRGSSFEQEYRLARVYCASGLMPKGLNTPEKVLVALQLCRELNLPPITSIGKVMVVNGTPSLFGDLPLAIVRKSGLMASISESFTLDEKGDVTSAVCVVKRKDSGEEISREFWVDDARKAGLFKNDIWTKYTKRMLQCRARAWALKDLFGDVLGGLSIGEWDHNATVEGGEIVGEVTESAAEKLNRMYLDNKGDSKDGQEVAV